MPARQRIPVTLPVAATAQRPQWHALPRAVREAVETSVGGRVDTAVLQNSGFTPGFASRLWLYDGSAVFVKAVSDEHPWLMEAFQTEAAKLAVLPAAVPTPRTRGTLTVPTREHKWFVHLLDDVDGAPPRRPQSLYEARTVLQAAVRTAEVLTPAPPGRKWVPIAAEIDPRPGWVDAVTLAISMHGDGLDADARLDESGALAAGEDHQVDVLLATLLGYFARAREQPTPETSPYLRQHQAWYGDVVADWLARRRGW